LVFTIIAGITIGLVFYQLNYNTTGMQDRAGFLFFLIFFFSLTSISSLSQFVTERSMFVRERRDGYYTILPFLVSKFLTDMLPLRVIPPLIFGSITYWMVGLRSDPFRFCSFLTVTILVNVVATSACLAISSLAVMCSSSGSAQSALFSV